jgi:hypothetical protein
MTKPTVWRVITYVVRALVKSGNPLRILRPASLPKNFLAEFAEGCAGGLRPPSIFLPILREALGICIAFSIKRGSQIDSPSSFEICESGFGKTSSVDPSELWKYRQM